jgi:hypothetical protein
MMTWLSLKARLSQQKPATITLANNEYAESIIQ